MGMMRLAVSVAGGERENDVDGLADLVGDADLVGLAVVVAVLGSREAS